MTTWTKPRSSKKEARGAFLFIFNQQGKGKANGESLATLDLLDQLTYTSYESYLRLFMTVHERSKEN